MKSQPASLSLLIALSIVQVVSGQGFVNLDFESAAIVPDPNHPFSVYIYASDAFPGWTAYVNAVPQTDVLYNAAPVGFSAVTLQGTNGVISALAGMYSACLYGQGTAIGQTGQIPPSAQSLVFWGTSSTVQVSFNGHTLSYFGTGSTANYTIYAADISAYAGQSGQLLFNEPFVAPGMIDNIQFSSSPIPEPNALGLFGIGTLIIWWRITRPNSRIGCGVLPALPLPCLAVKFPGKNRPHGTP